MTKYFIKAGTEVYICTHKSGLTDGGTRYWQPRITELDVVYDESDIIKKSELVGSIWFQLPKSAAPYIYLFCNVNRFKKYD